MEWIGKVIEAAKLPTKFIVGIFLVAIALLFLPQPLIDSLYLKDFKGKYGLYFGIIALSTGALLLIESILYFWKKIQIKRNVDKFKKQALVRIQRLDHAEKAVIREFYLKGQNTLKLPIDHPVVAGLINSGILQIVSSQGRMSLAGMLFSTKISDTVQKQLATEMIDLPTGQPTQEQIEFLRNNRPDFAASIEREESIFRW